MKKFNTISPSLIFAFPKFYSWHTILHIAYHSEKTSVVLTSLKLAQETKKKTWINKNKQMA